MEISDSTLCNIIYIISTSKYIWMFGLNNDMLKIIKCVAFKIYYFMHNALFIIDLHIYFFDMIFTYI